MNRSIKIDDIKLDNKPIYFYHFIDYETQIVLWSYFQYSKEEIDKVFNEYLKELEIWERSNSPEKWDKSILGWIDNPDYNDKAEYPDLKIFMLKKLAMEELNYWMEYNANRFNR